MPLLSPSSLLLLLLLSLLLLPLFELQSRSSSTAPIIEKLIMKTTETTHSLIYKRARRTFGAPWRCSLGSRDHKQFGKSKTNLKSNNRPETDFRLFLSEQHSQQRTVAPTHQIRCTFSKSWVFVHLLQHAQT